VSGVRIRQFYPPSDMSIIRHCNTQRVTIELFERI